MISTIMELRTELWNWPLFLNMERPKIDRCLTEILFKRKECLSGETTFRGLVLQMCGVTRTSLHKHSCCLQKQYKHVKAAAQKAVSKESMKPVAYIKIQSREVSD